MKPTARLNVLLLIVPVLFGSTLALGQTTTSPPTPQDSVANGSNAPARPGSWISDAIGTHRQRMAVVTNPQNGVTYPEDTSQDRHTLILTTVLESLFSTLQQLADALLLAAQVSGTTATTATGS